MDIAIKTRRLGAGSYDIDTPSGTYQLRNCPVDTSDDFMKGLPRGPRWMLTWPGEYSADSEFPTKREAVENVRTNEQWKADRAAKETATVTQPQETTVPDADFKPGQRITVADGTVHTVVKMAGRIRNEPKRVEVEGGLQWLAENCELAPEQPASVLCGHRKADPRGEYTDRIPVPAHCESGTAYGLWDEYAGGFTYAGDCRYEVAAEAVNWLTDPTADNYDPDGEYKVLAVCREHEDEPADTCTECFAEDEDN